jgi:hypothetical protein
MYVPGLRGLGSHEEGHRNYQHPRRTANDFGPELDNFSAWVVFLSISALTLEPRLWQILNAGDECLLFRSEDFQQPGRSRALHLLERSNRPDLSVLAGQFRRILSLQLHRIPNLDGLPQVAKCRMDFLNPILDRL